MKPNRRLSTRALFFSVDAAKRVFAGSYYRWVVWSVLLGIPIFIVVSVVMAAWEGIREFKEALLERLDETVPMTFTREAYEWKKRRFIRAMDKLKARDWDA